MKPQNIYAVYFSPIKNTRTVVRTIADGLGERLGTPVTPIDFTRPAGRTKNYEFPSDALVVFGTPTYAGRVPNKILPFVQSLFTGNQTLTVPVVTYGNRSMDNSLRELCKELEAHNFRTVAAAGITCQHAFSAAIGTGRPDEQDKAEITKFIQEVADKIDKAKTKEDLPSPVKVTGNDALEGY